MNATIIEKVSLNFTDLTGAKTGFTTLGSNKFWTGWVEQVGGSFSFECRWGSTGTAGSDKGSKRGIDKTTALKTLRDKAVSKQRKGYTLLDTRTVADEQAKAKAAGVTPDAPKTATKAKVASARSFHPEVERLLGTIYGSNSKAVRSGLSAQAGATADNPIGNLSDRQLNLGGEILDEIEDMLTGDLGHEDASNRSTLVGLGRDGRTPNARVIDLTNRFMSNVPREIDRANRGRANLHRLVIASYERLEEQRKFLQLLRDAHLSKDIFKAAAAAGPSDHSKVGVWHDGLGCEIEWCAPGSKEFKEAERIFTTGQSRQNANWWRGNQSRLRLEGVWRFTRNGSSQRFDAFSAKVGAKRDAVGNIWAWHGTRTANLLGIGKSGLLMPENLPRGVHISGKAFGRGIYHAPAWTATGTTKVHGKPTDGTNGALKSMNYTGVGGAYYGGNDNGNAFMFLQEVAVGQCEVRTTPCWDKRRPDRFPEHDAIYANAGGCSTLAHDEIVTFDEDAQVFRYLCEISVH